jgi:DNA-binding MarR family transcriptional regulator
MTYHANSESVPSSDAASLTTGQMRAWLAYVRVTQRMTYEMNRQLQADAELSLADYDVLAALSSVPEGRLQLTELATWIGWELSRLSHHTRRMGARGLIDRETSRVDGRATDAVLTELGREAIASAAPDHAALVKRLFFAPLTPELLTSLTEALEKVLENVRHEGTLPPGR